MFPSPVLISRFGWVKWRKALPFPSRKVEHLWLSGAEGFVKVTVIWLRAQSRCVPHWSLTALSTALSTVANETADWSHAHTHTHMCRTGAPVSCTGPLCFILLGRSPSGVSSQGYASWWIAALSRWGLVSDRAGGAQNVWLMFLTTTPFPLERRMNTAVMRTESSSI